MKKLLICLIIGLLSFTTPVYAAEAPLEIPSEWQKIFSDAPVSSQQMQSFSLSSLFKLFTDTVVERLTRPTRLFMRIIALLLFAALARGLCPDSSINNLGSVLDTVVTLAVFSLCSVPILELIESMITALNSNRTYLSAFVPVFASIMASCGQIGSAAIYSGFFLGTVMVISNILCTWALPAIRVFFALCVMDGVCNVIDFSKITAICVKVAKWLLMICATVFVAILGLQSSFANAADNVAIQTGKLLLSASVPVIGRAVSDAMSSVYAGLKMLKGTAGVALVGVLAASFIPLLIEGAVYYLLLSVSSMIASATGSHGASKMFSGISEGISLSMLFVFFFAVMAVLSTIIMILLGGGI